MASVYPKLLNVFFRLVESLGAPFLNNSLYFSYCPLAAFLGFLFPFTCVSTLSKLVSVLLFRDEMSWSAPPWGHRTAIGWSCGKIWPRLDWLSEVLVLWRRPWSHSPNRPPPPNPFLLKRYWRTIPGQMWPLTQLWNHQDVLWIMAGKGCLQCESEWPCVFAQLEGVDEGHPLGSIHSKARTDGRLVLMASGWSIKAFGGVWAKQGHGSMKAVTEAQPEPKLGEMKSRRGWLGAGLQGLLPASSWCLPS